MMSLFFIHTPPKISEDTINFGANGCQEDVCLHGIGGNRLQNGLHQHSTACIRKDTLLPARQLGSNSIYQTSKGLDFGLRLAEG